MPVGQPMHARGAQSPRADALQSNESELEARLVAEPRLDAGGEQVFQVESDAVDRELWRRALRWLARLEHDLASAREEERRKDEFLAMLAHELRNPLAPLQCTLAVLRGRFGSPALDRHFEVMERQMNSLGRIVDDLLEVSRATRGKIALRKERLEIAPIVLRAVESTRHRMEERRHELAITLPARPIFVLADPVRLEQVLVNLLVNSAKYTDPGGRVWIEVDNEPDCVELRVRDTGVGMSPEALEHAFDLFAQGGRDRDMARAQGGLGVGLSIVKTLVELHDGTVAARSPGPGGGSEFSVRLPLAEDQTELDVERRRLPLTPLPCRRVLVVDDNQDVADAMAALLEHLGQSVRIACDGPSALKMAAEWRPELVFLDIGLPSMDGYAVARELREGASPPVLVALTGYSQDGARARSLHAGFFQHLVKPPQLDAIQSVLLSAFRADPRAPDAGRALT